LADTDAAGVVYFASLLSICHEAYEAGLAGAGVHLREFLTDPTVALPIVKAEIQFFRPLFCGDRLRVEIEPGSIADDEFELEYTIVREGNTGTTAGIARTRHVCIDPRTRQRTGLPGSVRGWLKTL
jgi:1,4-dihydroxy-2-naphthoyl-CoA hydrolase